MKLLALLLLLGVVSPAGARVVHSFKRDCPQFFIRNPHNQNQVYTPTVLTGTQYQQICQRWSHGEPAVTKDYYATLYDTKHRIPIYSAYTFHQKGGGEREAFSWKIEPQLDEAGTADNAVMREIRPADEEALLFYNQALNKDYGSVHECYYTRGHVFPNSFAADEGQAESTFTLTNAAPQVQESNNEWAVQVEIRMRDEIQRDCAPTENRPAYVVTGVVPGQVWLPIKRGTEEWEQGVNIPSYYWSAYSCRDNSNQVHSNAFIAQQIYCKPNQKTNFNLRIMPVERLNKRLTEHYGQEFKIPVLQ
ncbi:endonuclease domain-containing 1 protein-like [Salminus brasiliensis]|uniref:endonuclease domain-containing 1 protein-like n=1 Tax=Salminus brasiliensis TaxID=930266 RepID=UPI003B82D9E3